MKSMLVQLLLVGAGGFIGSALRFLVSGLVYRLVPFTVFPYGTLAVNVLGCLIIGILTGFAEVRQVLGPGLRVFVLIGVLGGFTTFSTFGYETMVLATDGAQLKAGLNVVVSVVVCLVSVWLGHFLGSNI